jgi:hypothetical protein
MLAINYRFVPKVIPGGEKINFLLKLVSYCLECG